MKIHEERLDLLVLAWLWCQRGKPATPSNVATGIKAMAPAGPAKELVSLAIRRLVESGRAEQVSPAPKRGAAPFKISEAGAAVVRQWLGRAEPPAVRSPFLSLGGYDLPAVATGLSLARMDAKSLKAFPNKLLPLAVCALQFGLAIPLDRGFEAGKIELVKIALSRVSDVPADRIYLKKLPTGELPALVAGTLLGEPGTAIANLDKLLVAVACKILHDCKATQIKFAVVRRWLSLDLDISASHAAAHEIPATDAPAIAQLDLATFSRQAVAAAQAVARRGGQGVSSLGDKVLVYFAWREYEKTHGPLPLEQFKRNLSDVNGDNLVLVAEDLIPADRVQEFNHSQVTTGASRYHYIRVGNLGGSHA